MQQFKRIALTHRIVEKYLNHIDKLSSIAYHCNTYVKIFKGHFILTFSGINISVLKSISYIRFDNSFDHSN